MAIEAIHFVVVDKRQAVSHCLIVVDTGGLHGPRGL